MAAEIVIDEQLDASGLTCPLPLLKAKQALNRMDAGQVLEVTCTDPGSVRDFKVFSDQSGHVLLKSDQQSGTYIYWLKKA
jgi:TusA-related sulfurtransferase